MSEQHHNPHEKIEKNVGLLAVLIAVAVSFGGLACAAVFGIILNAILPGKDYEFKE